MIRALLDGRKTQTRRVLQPQPSAICAGFQKVFTDPPRFEAIDANGKPCNVFAGKLGVHPYPPIRFAKGDRLWVREAWRCNGWASDVATIFYRASEGDGYTAMCEQWLVADHKPLRVETKWSPSLHLPRWASRLTLTVTDVRVQRLQDITPADAIAEGIWAPANSMTIDCETRDPRDDFQALWNSINGADSWDANPWVVALTFTVERRNIDA